MREVERLTIGPINTDENLSVTVIHEEGDYTTPDGFHHIGGVHKVSAYYGLSGKAYRGKAYKGRAKTFKGETAWMDAERLFSDIVNEIRFARMDDPIFTG